MPTSTLENPTLMPNGRAQEQAPLPTAFDGLKLQDVLALRETASQNRVTTFIGNERGGVLIRPIE
jgi:hypothetical protein